MPQQPLPEPVAPDNFIHIGDLRGGRNGHDPAASLPDDECAEARNVDWNNGSKIIARRRFGCEAIDMTGSTLSADVPVENMHRHIPSSDETQAELWAIDADEVINRLSRGFLANVSVTFDSTHNTGIWTPHVAFDPRTVLAVAQRVKIDGNVYTINAVSNVSFTTNERSSVDYTATGVAPESALWTAPAQVDSMTGATIQTAWASLDNKLIIANQFTLDTFGHHRLHLWDATANSNVGLIRRAGIAPSLVAPTPLDNNANGSYANTGRYYRHRWVERRFLPGFSNPMDVPVVQRTMSVGANNYVTTFSHEAMGNTTLTVSSNLAVTVYASAGGGGGGGSAGTDGFGGGGGGGGASSNTGFQITLVAGKTYTLCIGAAGVGGVTGANGGDTFIYNVTDSAYLFHYAGGKGGGATGGAGGAGGAVLVGPGIAGGAGGTDTSSSAPGGAGAGNPGGTGGGGAGGYGCGGVVDGPPQNGGGGGGSGAEAGQPAEPWSGISGDYAHGGRGGEGGGVHIVVPGIADGTFGLGGWGAGGFPTSGSTGGAGVDGWCVLYFTASAWQPGIDYDATMGSAVWTPTGGTLDPSEFLLIGEQVLIDGNVYTITAVNSSSFTSNIVAPTNYSSVAVQTQPSIVYRRSEPSPSVAFTPDGAHDAVAVTHSFPPKDEETHWELEGSIDDGTYYVLGTFPKTYATAQDTHTYTANGTFSLGALSDPVGTYNVPQAAKFVAGDQNRLLSFGSWNPNDPQNRVEFSAVRGSLNIGDTERVPLGNYRDLDENDGGEPTGLVGPIFGQFFAFKINQFWRFTPTGNSQIFAAEAVSKTTGALPRTIVVGEDESGNPALYWFSPSNGPCRYIINPFGVGRLEYLGSPIVDRLDGTVSKIEYSTVFDPTLGLNLFFSHAVYYPALRQVWFYILTAREPLAKNNFALYTKFVFNIGRTATNNTEGYRSGWSYHEGDGLGPASVVFSRTIGAQMSHDLCPYVAPGGHAGQIWQCDVPGVNTDAGALYKAYVISKAFTSGLHRQSTIHRSYVLASIANNTFLTQTIVGDYGVQSTVSVADMRPKTGEKVIARRRFADAGMADVGSVQFTWGDGDFLDQHWEIAEIVIEMLPKEIA